MLAIDFGDEFYMLYHILTEVNSRRTILQRLSQVFVLLFDNMYFDTFRNNN